MTAMLVRVWWWALLGVGAVMYVAALPWAYREIRDGERSLFASPAVMRAALAETGWSTSAYAAVVLALLVLYTVAAVGAAVLIRRTTSETPALFVSTILMAHGFGWPMVMDALAGRWAVYDAVGGVIAVYGFVGFFGLAFVFPDGRFVPGWTRWVLLAMAVETGLSSAGVPTLGALPGVVGEVGETLLGVTVVATMIYAVVTRYRGSDPEQRQQWRGVGVALLTLAVTFVLVGMMDPFVPDAGAAVVWVELAGMALFTIGFAALPLAFAAAVLRRGLWGTARVLRRAMVLAVLTTMMTVGYVVVVIAFGAAIGRYDSPVATTAGALAVALMFEPARRTATSWATRMTLGDRNDPGRAVVRLSQRLDDARDPRETLPAVLSAVREAVRSPGAELLGTGVDTCHGQVGTAALTLPLSHLGEDLGELRVAHRGGEEFDARDRALLAELARSVALAVHAVRQHTQALRLTEDLQHSRERLVTAREEERRRLRRDLHDGLGPVLAGQVLRLEAARDLAGTDPDRSRELLDRALTEAVAALEEVKRVVDGLRPPTLDEAGLEHAIRSRSGQLGDRVVVRASPERLPELPAAVEVAAFHIASEAITNAVRHAPGARCEATIELVDGRLVLTVQDDGPGLRVNGARRGNGLATMAERAAEVGGTVSYDPGPDGGTRVTAILPVHAAEGVL